MGGTGREGVCDSGTVQKRDKLVVDYGLVHVERQHEKHCNWYVSGPKLSHCDIRQIMYGAFLGKLEGREVIKVSISARPDRERSWNQFGYLR